MKFSIPYCIFVSYALTISIVTDSFSQVHSKFRYELLKPKPSKSEPMLFVDEKIKIEFLIDRTSINFILQNKGDRLLKVIWDEASLSINGRSERVTHKGVKNIDRTTSQPATVIPPRSSIDDLMIPVDNIYWSNTFSDWGYRPLIEDYGNIEQQIGTIVSLYMPVIINSKESYYVFDFKVNGLISN